VGEGLNICGQGNVGRVLVVALAGCLPGEVGNWGWGMGADSIMDGGWVVYAAWHSCR